ncbi:MAG TPA: hypothetical protein VFK42_16330 [Acidimicrobiales bacterium]|nr:hypothetical protein [Acidimicrobiales bacterium]
MSRRRLLRGATALALAAAPVIGLTAGAASADPPDRSGWWWQANNDTVAGLGVAPPAPPDAPQGGMYVAGSTAQPLAISAIHLQSQTTGGSATMTLHAENAGFASVPGLLACPTHSYWAPVEAGAWSQAPKAECDAAGGGVAGTASTDGSSMTWKLTSAFEVTPGEWNVVLVPPAEPSHVAISPAGDDAVVVSGGTPVSSDAGFDGGTTGGPAFDEAPLDAGSLSPVFDVPAPSDSAFALPASPAPATSPAPAGPSSAPGASPAPVANGAGSAIPASVSIPRPGRAHRVMAFLLLAALAAVLWWFGGTPARPPRRLGALVDGGVAEVDATDTGVARGIGRFRRPRDGGGVPRI